MNKKIKFYYYKPGSVYDLYCSQNITYIYSVDIPCITAAVLALIPNSTLKIDKEVFREFLE